MTPRLWTWPIVLAGASLFGLVAALLADGWWDVLSTAALAKPLVVALGCIVRRPRGVPTRLEPRSPYSCNQEPGSP